MCIKYMFYIIIVHVCICVCTSLSLSLSPAYVCACTCLYAIGNNGVIEGLCDGCLAEYGLHGTTRRHWRR